ncbi:sulfurtransferase [Ruania halotolerans]|nr:sulfurtransferase [Ruania halotolerans]UFU08435.1 sulfurtransferase [Ruania halotolerans]
MADRDARSSVLISAADLHDLLERSERVVVLDVRWSLAEPDGRKFYIAGHIPGAQFVDLDRDLAGPPSSEAGRHPLPEVTDLQAAARRWGIDDGDPVVVYDDTGGTSAARAWWLLRWAGLVDVRILDGGLHAWSENGGILEDGEVLVGPGTVTLSAGHMPVADADAAAAAPVRGVLLDARARDRYAGETEPVDRRAGHIPGAVSAPTAENLDEAQRFRTGEELAERFVSVGAPEAGEVVVYCGSGVTAAHEVAALAAIGVPARLYAGSWSQWSADDARPVATGFPGGRRA